MSEKKSVNRSDYVASQERSDAPSRDDIARLAYALWEARGGGDGGAEDDWLEAEQQLQERTAKGHAA